MSYKFTAIAAASVLALVATPSARAALTGTGSWPGEIGNSSVVFVAIDLNYTDSEGGGTISYTADLGQVITDFMPQVENWTSSAGALSTPGTVARFNLLSNTVTVNGEAVAGDFQWSGALSTFLGNASVQANGYAWGVVAGDMVSGDPSATNTIRGQNLFWSSGSVVDYDNSGGSGIHGGSVSDGASHLGDFFINSNGLGTQLPGVHGANTATGGSAAFLGIPGSGISGYFQGNFGQQFGANTFLNYVGDTSYFSWARANGGAGFQQPYTQTLGGSSLIHGEPFGDPPDYSDATTWFWDAATGDLVYTVPVPEASTTTMMVLGLGAMALALRGRRRQD